MQPLYNKNVDLIGWFDGVHVFDTNMNWVAFVVNDNAWSSKDLSWIGPVIDLNFLDNHGKVFAWNPDCEIKGCYNPLKPYTPYRPYKPYRPYRPYTPYKPYKPYAPLNGWSQRIMF